MDYLLAANDGLKILVGVSILFVWVVRYHNIVEEFKLKTSTEKQVINSYSGYSS